MATIRCKDQCFENIQTVLFDKDGTLANVEDYLIALSEARTRQVAAHAPALKNSFLQLFGFDNGDLDPAGLMAVGSREENKIAIAAQLATAGYGWIEALSLVEQSFHQAKLTLPEKVKKTVPLDGALAFLQQLSQIGITLAIVSSDTQPNVEAFIRHYQIPNIRWYCGAASGVLPKTHPDFLDFACESIGIAPSSTLVVGDSAADLVMASHGAAGFLGMTGGWRQWQRPTTGKTPQPVLPGIETDLPTVLCNRFDLVESYL